MIFRAHVPMITVLNNLIQSLLENRLESMIARSPEVLYVPLAYFHYYFYFSFESRTTPEFTPIVRVEPCGIPIRESSFMKKPFKTGK